MLENMTTGEKVIAGATAVGIAALIFHKPTRNAVGLSDGKKKREKYNRDYFVMTELDVPNAPKHTKVPFSKEVKMFVTFESGKKYQKEFSKYAEPKIKKMFKTGNTIEFKNGNKEVVKTMTLRNKNNQ